MRAVFLDRDGVINELVYYPEMGIIDSPFTPEQFRLLPGAGKAISRLRRFYKVIIVSNQPGIAKGHMTADTFALIREKMREDLAGDGTYLDAEYYCLHHPEAQAEWLRADCQCRKPKPGLLLQAARELNIDLTHSWMIGDGLTDIKAGKSAGTRTILLGRFKCELCHLMAEENAQPDAIAASLVAAAELILKSTQIPAESRKTSAGAQLID